MILCASHYQSSIRGLYYLLEQDYFRDKIISMYFNRNEDETRPEFSFSAPRFRDNGANILTKIPIDIFSRATLPMIFGFETAVHWTRIQKQKNWTAAQTVSID